MGETMAKLTREAFNASFALRLPVAVKQEQNNPEEQAAISRT